MHGRRKGWRWFQRALAVVDPSAFADSVESYISDLSLDDVRSVALASLKRMGPSDRVQFGLYIDEASLTEAHDELLPRRFTAFLRENPRSVEALGPEALDGIFTRLDSRHPEPVEAPRHRELADRSRHRELVERLLSLPQHVLKSFHRPKHLSRPLNPQTLALIILAVLVAVVPLAAQYAHQRGMLQGLSDGTLLSAVNIPVLHHAPARAAHPHSAAHRKQHVHPRPRFVARANVHKPHRAKHNGRIAFVPHHRVAHHVARARPRVVAADWKFDRRNYAYFRSPHFRSHPSSRSHPSFRSHPRSRFQERAELAVQSYLDALIAGNTRSALQHLGLPPDADFVNLSEVPIISRNSRARVVAVKPAANGNTQVEADIKGRRGEYFEVFYVAADGPALRITDRYYIPVSK